MNGSFVAKSSDRVKGFTEAAVHQMLSSGQKYEAAGEDVVYMVQGEPDFTTPGIIHDEIYRAASSGHTHYTPAVGLKPLRSRLCDQARKDNSIPVSGAEEVIITTGATQGLFIALMALIDPGDEVILLEPGYIATYSKMIRMAGGKSVVVGCSFDGQRFPLDIHAVEAAITPQTRAIVLNTPVNPTGTVYTRPELEALANLVLKHGLIVISDEAYESLVFDTWRHVSFASLGREVFEQTVSVYTCSKTLAMTGWRVGYNLARPEIINWMNSVQTVSARCASAPAQYGLLAAMDSPQLGDDLRKMFSAYADRRDAVQKALHDIPDITLPAIAGTFYAFPQFGSGNLDSYEFARRLLDQEKVVTTPGAYYGNNGEGHLRLSFAYEKDRVLEGIARIRRFWERENA